MLITNLDQITELKEKLRKNHTRSLTHVKEILAQTANSDALLVLKFDKTAFSPISGEPLNFIEMLNQYYSDHVMLLANPLKKGGYHNPQSSMRKQA